MQDKRHLVRVNRTTAYLKISVANALLPQQPMLPGEVVGAGAKHKIINNSRAPDGDSDIETSQLHTTRIASSHHVGPAISESQPVQKDERVHSSQSSQEED